MSESASHPGIIYFSTIPTGMNVCMISDIARQFGAVGRIYLVPKAEKKGGYRQYEEGWVEFLKKKSAIRAAESLNSSYVPGSKRNPWAGELWNVRYLEDATWKDLFSAEHEEEEQRRAAHDRDIVTAKRDARKFTAIVNAKELAKRLSKKGIKRGPKNLHTVDLSRRQKLSEEEILSRIARSNRTPPDGSSRAAISDPEFMKNLFSGGL